MNCFWCRPKSSPSNKSPKVEIANKEKNATKNRGVRVVHHSSLFQYRNESGNETKADKVFIKVFKDSGKQYVISEI